MAALGYEVYVPQPYVESQQSILEKEINAIQTELLNTDYIALKSIEGYDCDTLYPGWKVKRANLRNRINEIEEQIKNLEENND